MMRRCISALAKATVPLNPLKPFAAHLPEGSSITLPDFPKEVEVDSDVLMKDLEMMLTIRRLETLADQGYKLKKIRGFIHLYTGEEAIATGMSNILTWEDDVITSYRCHGWYLNRGGTPRECLGEMFSKFGGASKGKGGSMHIYKPQNHFFGGDAIVGSQVPIGAGLGWPEVYFKDKPEHVSVAVYGDGASNQGQVWETQNFAALLKIPCIFAIENNEFGMATAEKRHAYDINLYRRTEFLPGIKCDGMDILAVREATRIAKDYCLAGNGPIVLELSTYRYFGHSVSDPGTAYRTREDVDKVRNERDPIAKLKTVMESVGFIDEAGYKALEKKVRKNMDDELKAADAMPDPPLSELATDIVLPADRIPVKTCQGTVYA